MTTTKIYTVKNVIFIHKIGFINYFDKNFAWYQANNCNNKRRAGSGRTAGAGAFIILDIGSVIRFICHLIEILLKLIIEAITTYRYVLSN